MSGKVCIALSCLFGLRRPLSALGCGTHMNGRSRLGAVLMGSISNEARHVSPCCAIWSVTRCRACLARQHAPIAVPGALMAAPVSWPRPNAACVESHACTERCSWLLTMSHVLARRDEPWPRFGNIYGTVSDSKHLLGISVRQYRVDAAGTH